jgi:hypothetical protein
MWPWLSSWQKSKMMTMGRSTLAARWTTIMSTKHNTYLYYKQTWTQFNLLHPLKTFPELRADINFKPYHSMTHLLTCLPTFLQDTRLFKCNHWYQDCNSIHSMPCTYTFGRVPTANLDRNLKLLHKSNYLNYRCHWKCCLCTCTPSVQCNRVRPTQKSSLRVTC